MHQQQQKLELERSILISFASMASSPRSTPAVLEGSRKQVGGGAGSFVQRRRRWQCCGKGLGGMALGLMMPRPEFIKRAMDREGLCNSRLLASLDFPLHPSSVPSQLHPHPLAVVGLPWSWPPSRAAWNKVPRYAVPVSSWAGEEA